MATLYGDLMTANGPDQFYEALKRRNLTISEAMEQLYGDGVGLCPKCQKFVIGSGDSYCRQLLKLMKILQKAKHKHL